MINGLTAFLSFLSTLVTQKIGWVKMAVIGGIGLVGFVVYLGVATNWRF